MRGCDALRIRIWERFKFCVWNFIARALGPNQFGLYALGLTIFNTLSDCPLGLDTGVVKFVSQQRGMGRRTKHGARFYR